MIWAPCVKMDRSKIRVDGPEAPLEAAAVGGHDE